MIQTPGSEVDVQLKLAALWTSVSICYLYGDYFELYVPGTVEGLVTGDNNLHTPLNLLAAAVMLAAPALMICLSVLMKPSSNRVLNLCMGGLFTIVVGITGARSISEWRAFYVLYACIEAALTIGIVRIAWRWNRYGVT